MLNLPRCIAPSKREGNSKTNSNSHLRESHLEEEVRKKTRKEKESEHGNNDPMAASE
jgi:hypothetical protein